MNQKDRRTRVFIIGAGLGGLSAAWFLSKHRPDVDVIVCEASWVPGGKAVSGRAAPPVGGGTPHFVEEHGLHMLFGTYQQTWQMLADCYEEVDRPVSHAFRRIEQAFTPQKLVVFDERASRGGRRQHWVFSPDEREGNPWDPGAPPPLDDMGLLGQLIGQMGTQSRNLQATAVRMRGGASALPFLNAGAPPTQGVTRPSYKVEMPDTDAMRSWTRKASSACSPRRTIMVQSPPPTVGLAQFLRLATSARRAAELLDLIFAILDGTRDLVRTCTCPIGGCHCFDQLNADDLHVWLRTHGLREDNDAIVRGFYAGLFARPGDLAAGVGLRAILRVLFDYRGALVYRMESGMGEVVVAPLYKTLRNRRVEFRFFHRLTGLDLVGNRISQLHFEGLGALRKGFDPLTTTESLQGTIDYFPNTPPPESLATLGVLAHGEFRQMHRRWTSTGSPSPVALDENDIVILAVPPKVLKQVAPVLETNPAWAEFLSGGAATRSCRIASAQIWRNVASDATQNPIGRGVAAGQAEPFNVWADMSHILTREGVPHHATELSFVCGVEQADAAATQAAQLDGLAAQVKAWLSSDESSFMLGRTGKEVHRYLAASLEPSDEYVLSAPGTVERRIEPANSGFVNLRVAGDWVRNGLDCGCVESAVTGGILAAKSIP